MNSSPYFASKVDYLRPIFDEWARTYTKASTEYPQSKESYYVERTVVALLAAAAWRVGVPAVQEMLVRRQTATGSRKGRADLFLKLDRRSTAIEAKIHWFNDDGGFEDVIAKLEKACEEVRKLELDDNYRRLGLCFGVVERGYDRPASLMQRCAKRLRRESIDLLLPLSSKEENETLQYPGCLVLGRACD